MPIASITLDERKFLIIIIFCLNNSENLPKGIPCVSQKVLATARKEKLLQVVVSEVF